MEAYVPRLGDLVFFEHDQRLISKTVGRLGGPPMLGLQVSHCAIVSEANRRRATLLENTLMITDTWHAPDPIGGARESSLADTCKHDGPRRLLVVRREQSSAFDVASAAEPWLKSSDYSIPLLLLAGLASLLRRLACTREPNQYWNLVHLHARAIDDRARYEGRLVGTCAGTLADIESTAGQDLGVKEPHCPGRLDAWREGPHVFELIEAMAAVAWLEAHVLERRQQISERVTAELRKAEAGFVEEPVEPRRPAMAEGSEVVDRPPNIDREGSPGTDGRGNDRFGPGAAKWVLHQLRHVLVLRRADNYRLLCALLITFDVLDELLDAQPDGVSAPKSGDAVYLPLMPLDLILTKFKAQKQLCGPFAPYEDR